ncbi:MAG: hypothetical protein PVF28_00735 [Thioalkalispiraceae bacterium]|jgi:hypothetical protein
MECVSHYLLRDNPKLLSAVCATLLTCNLLSTDPAYAQQPHYTHAELRFQAIDIDLNFEGAERETRVNSIDFSLREQLASRLDGAFLLGYINALQNSNPIYAGQDMVGEYLGLDLQFYLIQQPRFTLLSRFAYRYSLIDAEVDEQKMEWKWHQASIGLHSQTYISKHLYLNLGASVLTISGVEKASGTIDQSIDFKAKDSLTGLIGLQLDLDRTGRIGVEFKAGSMQGGRIVFQRAF